jgi:hypothetical protein
MPPPSPPLRDAVLWPAVQHKTFTAIYPPAAEWLFVLLAAVAASPLFFKSVFVLADLATTLLLVRKFGQARAAGLSVRLLDIHEDIDDGTSWSRWRHLFPGM